MNRTTALVATILLALLSLTVGAQVYRWVDKDGKVQYSDQPPPPGATKAEATRINASSSNAAASASAAAKASDKAAEKGKPADKGSAVNADAAKQSADNERQAKETEESCRATRAQLRTLQDGGRITTTTPDGERSLMSDEQIAAEAAKLQKQIADNCK